MSSDHPRDLRIAVTGFLLVVLSGIGPRPALAAPVAAPSLPPVVQLMPVVGGLVSPVFVTGAHDNSGRLFILQQTGQILIFSGGALLGTPFLNIAGLVSNFTGQNGEQGLLSLVFDPGYSSNRRFYITYTTNTTDPTFKYTTTLARYQTSAGNPNVADPASGTVLLSIPKKYTNHNGGMLAFGPDGYLYMSMGDGGSGGDPDGNGQNLHVLLAKILRLDVSTPPPAGQQYVIPPTNPFVRSSDPNVRREIWAYGVRNPWRFSFDTSTGDLYVADVGQNREEEVDFQAAGAPGGQNYGWNILEGNLCYNPSTGCVPPSGYVPPVTTYDHQANDAVGCSVTGGYVYRGADSPALQGVYLYGDFCSGRLWGLIRNADGTWSSGLLALTNFNVSSFGQDDRGELYLVSYAGGIYKLTADNGSHPTVVTLYPSDGSQVCQLPTVGADLSLTGSGSRPASFDPSTLRLFLDGQDVTAAAHVSQSRTGLTLLTSILYTPPMTLGLGAHVVDLHLLSALEPGVVHWSFTAANIACAAASASAIPLIPFHVWTTPASPSGSTGGSAAGSP